MQEQMVYVLPDMTIEESKEYLEYSKKLELASVFLVAPNTSNFRIKKNPRCFNRFCLCSIGIWYHWNEKFY